MLLAASEIHGKHRQEMFDPSWVRSPSPNREPSETHPSYNIGEDLRVANDRKDDVFVSFDFEIEAPTARHSSLPNVLGLAVFLGM